jgi:PadR family transcriptional regulator, regulatory protein PadR
MPGDSRIDVQAMGRRVHELLLLAALKARPCHGYALAQAVADRSRGRVVLQHGTLYPILHELERQNYIASRKSEVDGRSRRVYALTHAGASRLRSGQAALQRDVEQLLEALQPLQ